MFNLDQLESLSVVSNTHINIDVLTDDQVSRVLLGESIQNMTRPITRMSTNPTVAKRQETDRAFSVAVTKSKHNTCDALVNLATQAVMNIASARQSEEDEAEQNAIERLDAVCSYLASVASNVARNSYYRYQESLNREGDVEQRLFESRSTYAGWKSVSVEPDVMEDGAQLAIDSLLSLLKATLPHASSWMRGFMTNDQGGVHVQLGYRKISEDEANQYYTLKDVWSDLDANKRDVKDPLSTKEIVSGFDI